MNINLSEAEQAALDFLKRNGGAVLITAIEDKTEKGVFGEVIPGIAIYKKLAKKGLLQFTEEDPIPEWDGFTFTPMIELF